MSVDNQAIFDYLKENLFVEIQQAHYSSWISVKLHLTNPSTNKPEEIHCDGFYMDEWKDNRDT